jgi:hypothetical protein
MHKDTAVTKGTLLVMLVWLLLLTFCKFTIIKVSISDCNLGVFVDTFQRIVPDWGTVSLPLLRRDV